MATAREVMLFLRPNDSWVMRGEEYEGLEILNGEPLTKEEFLAAFDLVDAAKAQAHEEVKAKKKRIIKKIIYEDDSEEEVEDVSLKQQPNLHTPAHYN